jgi:nucleotidyltransferase/DNA polymerase involved in DNA repair
MPVTGQRPVGDLWGVGPKTVKKLDELGLPTIAELAAADLETLRQRFPIRAARWLSDIEGNIRAYAAPFPIDGRKCRRSRNSPAVAVCRSRNSVSDDTGRQSRSSSSSSGIGRRHSWLTARTTQR